jgi:uncharacterized membrane protein
MARAETAPLVETAVTSGTRIVLLDFARALATLFMLQGHTIDALLAGVHRHSAGYYAWFFVRGLTPVTFMFVSGFTFSVMTFGQEREVDTRTTLRRLRRFALLLGLGYILHFPAAKLQHLAVFSPAQWRALLSVDVLQCIAVMLATLQLTTLVPRRHRGTVLGGLAVAVVCLTPLMWRTDWTTIVPLAIASYLSPATGSQFPLFPWLGYGALGAAVGVLYLRARAADRAQWYTPAVLFSVAAALLVSAYLVAQAPWQLLGETSFWTTSPSQFLMRAGLVCLAVTALAALTLRYRPRVEALEALAQTSLAVYIIHVCLVYGSPFNTGLRQVIGATQTPMQAALWAAGMWAAMIALAWCWARCRRDYARVAVALRVALGAFLLIKLL